MNNPLVSILILTCARSKNLEEAIFSALNQDYQNIEVIVLNGRPEQELYIKNDKVKILNIDCKEMTISQKKNILIDNALGEILTVLDDDDLLIKNHVTNHVNNIKDVEASISFQCTFWERKINKITICPYTANLAFRNNKKIKYIDDKNADFDQHFRNYILNNVKYKILDNSPTYIYCWNNDLFHMCGLGNEKNFLKDVEYRFQNNIEPTGKIEIIPQIKEDAKKLIEV